MADKMMRRARSDLPWANDLNRWADTLMGNTPGRIKLWGDGGNELDLIDGTVISANNYPLDVRSDVGYHGRFRNAADTADVLFIRDSGITATVPAVFNGNVTIGDAAGDTLTVNATSTFAASATFQVNVTLGDAAGDTITINGTLTANAAATFNGNVTLGSDSADTLTINAVTTANANVTLAGSSVLTLPAGAANAPSLVVGDAGGLFRQAAGVLGFSTGGAERARLSSTGLLMAAATPITLANTQAYQALDSGGTARSVAVLTNIDTVTLGYSASVQTDVDGAIVRIRAGTTTRIRVDSTGIGFFGATAVGQPTVSGSRGGNAALTDLLAELDSLGLINDTTTA